MKVRIDEELCQGHAVCMGEAANVFRVDDDGVVTVLADEPPAVEHERVRLAARYCPTGAVRIEED